MHRPEVKVRSRISVGAKINSVKTRVGLGLDIR